MPLFHILHFQSSFYPRAAMPGRVVIEKSVGAETLNDLRARVRDLELAAPCSVGRLTAAKREADGLLRGTAPPRLMQAYVSPDRRASI